jgi:hypothetical protein
MPEVAPPVRVHVARVPAGGRHQYLVVPLGFHPSRTNRKVPLPLDSNVLMPPDQRWTRSPVPSWSMSPPSHRVVATFIA